MSESADFIDLSDKSHYEQHFNFSTAEMLSAYDSLLRSFLRHIKPHIETHKPIFAIYILTKGLNMIFNVFNMTIYHTKSLVATCNSIQSSILLFCEFVSQINHDKYNYLQLSIRDATIFVYRKTVYKLDKKYVESIQPKSSEYQILKILEAVSHLNENICSLHVKNLNGSYPNIEYLDKKLEEINKKSISFAINKTSDKSLADIIMVINKVFYVLTSEINNDIIIIETITKLISFLKSKETKNNDIYKILWNITTRLSKRQYYEFLSSTLVTPELIIRQLIKPAQS